MTKELFDRIENGTIRRQRLVDEYGWEDKNRERREEQQFRQFLRCKTGCFVSEIGVR